MLTLLHSERPKLRIILVFLSAIGLNPESCLPLKNMEMYLSTLICTVVQADQSLLFAYAVRCPFSHILS